MHDKKQLAEMRKNMSRSIDNVKIERRFTYRKQIAPPGKVWFVIQQKVKSGRYELGVPVEVSYLKEHGEKKVFEELKTLYLEAFEKK